MATNVSYASGDTNLESLVLHTLPSFGEHGNGIINQNLLLAYLESKGRKVIEDGGLEFWFGVRNKENSNFKWQGKNDTMTANSQDPNIRLRYPIKIFTGSVVVNDLEKAQNKGRAMIKSYLRELRQQAEDTISNQFNSGFWDSNGGTGDLPESIPSLISITPTVGAIGGQSRVGEPALQNHVYTTAIADIGSEAGVSALKRLLIQTTVGKEVPDLVIMDSTVYAGFIGYLETKRQYRNNETMANLGFDTVQMGRTTIGYESLTVLGGANTITSGYMYGITSKFMYFKILADGNFKWDDKFERIGQQLNSAVYFKAFCNLCNNNPRGNFVATSVAST